MQDYGFITLILAMALATLGVVLNGQTKAQARHDHFMESCLTDQKLYQCEVLWQKAKE
jgi:hypothetical protein